MSTFYSDACDLGPVRLPPYSGLRVMMLPIRFDDPGTVPDLAGYRTVILDLIERLDGPHPGVGYVTIDEAMVPAGETHRRPGRHVDGVDTAADGGAWGGDGGGGWGGRLDPAGRRRRGGMILASSVTACRGWVGTFRGCPRSTGDCSHLDASADVEPLTLHAGRAYWCGPMFVHETMAHPEPVRRQFLRLSTPSPHPWYEGYTPSPYGVQPGGPIRPPRVEMGYRAGGDV